MMNPYSSSSGVAKSRMGRLRVPNRSTLGRISRSRGRRIIRSPDLPPLGLSTKVLQRWILPGWALGWLWKRPAPAKPIAAAPRTYDSKPELGIALPLFPGIVVKLAKNPAGFYGSRLGESTILYPECNLCGCRESQLKRGATNGPVLLRHRRGRSSSFGPRP